MRIGVFKPTNIRIGNAFDTGQHAVFREVARRLDASLAYFTDAPDTAFEGAETIQLSRRSDGELARRALRKLRLLPYSRIPNYGRVDFAGFDVVITEGVHYSLLAYLDGFRGRIFLNDSITTDYRITRRQRDYLHGRFGAAVAVVVNAKIPRLYARSQLRIRTAVIGHALPLDRIRFRHRTSHQGRLISVGRLREEKGMIYLIDALARLRRDMPEVSLDIVGDGPLRVALADRIRTLGEERAIRLVGSLPHADLLARLDDYDAFVSHPIELAHSAEAFHLANMEAMAAGLPVVSTDCGGVPAVAGGNAVLGRQRSAEDACERIRSLLSDPALFARLSRDGRTHAEATCSLDRIASRWIRLLTE